MMNTPMDCELFSGRLADYLESDVDESTRVRMDAHAASCGECAALLGDLRALRIEAAHLPSLVPSHDLWAGIAARIETPVVQLRNAAAIPSAAEGSRRRRHLWAGLAAAGLVIATASVTRELTMRSVAASAPSKVVAAVAPATATPAVVAPSTATTAVAMTAAATPAVTSPVGASAARATEGVRRVPRPAARGAAMLVANRPSAEETYDREIANLRRVVNHRRPQLDSATVTIIEQNLRVIDAAIAQCRTALKKDPASRFLMESLNDAMDNKVQLLRTAAALPSRT